MRSGKTANFKRNECGAVASTLKKCGWGLNYPWRISTFGLSLNMAHWPSLSGSVGIWRNGKLSVIHSAKRTRTIGGIQMERLSRQKPSFLFPPGHLIVSPHSAARRLVSLMDVLADDPDKLKTAFDSIVGGGEKSC